MRKGYRNCDTNFNIESEVEQFNFSRTHSHLKIDIDWTTNEHLAPIERTNFYLKDGRLIKNIFIVNGALAYYYEEESYYPEDPRESPPIPEENLFIKFGFTKDEIILIKADNNPHKPFFNVGHWIRIDWLFFHKPNPLDTTKAIKENIFIQEANWKELPIMSEDDLYISPRSA